jgi:hypothetical protein
LLFDSHIYYPGVLATQAGERKGTSHSYCCDWFPSSGLLQTLLCLTLFNGFMRSMGSMAHWQGFLKGTVKTVFYHWDLPDPDLPPLLRLAQWHCQRLQSAASRPAAVTSCWLGPVLNIDLDIVYHWQGKAYHMFFTQTWSPCRGWIPSNQPVAVYTP